MIWLDIVYGMMDLMDDEGLSVIDDYWMISDYYWWMGRFMDGDD